MHSIGFKNFRRFADFPTIDLGDVTILVGGNNSGKSTVVKALLLCVDNLRSMRMSDRRRNESYSLLSFSKPIFRFDTNEFHDVKVKTFARAIHNKPITIFDPLSESSDSEKLELPSTITFRFTIGQFMFMFYVSGDPSNEDITSADVDIVSIIDLKSNVRYINNYRSNIMSFTILGDENNDMSLLHKITNDFDSAVEALEKAKEEGDLDEITKQTALIDKLTMNLKSLSGSGNDAFDVETANDSNIQDSAEVEGVQVEVKNFIKAFNRAINKAVKPKASYEMPLGILRNEVNEPVVLNVITNLLFFVSQRELKPKMKEGEDPNEYGARMQHYQLMNSYREAMKQEESTLNRSYRDLKRLLDSFNVEYISAHAANQNTLYNTADRNDYIAQTVHEFYSEKIIPGEMEYEFVKEWMKEFEIGVNFRIRSIDGEAYQVSITDSDGTSVCLADKGMGSIQMMILLLRLATIIRHHNRSQVEDNEVRLFDEHSPVPPTTIIIEEPEQNLHPKMQSLLANLFCEIAKMGFQFVIETHSEYLVRKTQVLVAESNYVNEDDLIQNNPFKVYYLPMNDTPYEMHYETTGGFVERFGEGFFDAATDLDRVIIQKEAQSLPRRKRK